MFSLEETLTWTVDDVFARIRSVLPAGWVIERSVVEGWHHVVLRAGDGVEQWSAEHADAKIVGLDSLVWLRLRSHQVRHPVWKPREAEVPLHQAPGAVISSEPDPEDLDPSEVAAVYRTSR